MTAATLSTAPSPTPASRLGAHIGLVSHAVLAAVTFIPLLLTAPGRVVADSKQLLYLDPSMWLSRAPYLWDQHLGMGTVTHQNIGYLFPMGPYFWLMDRLDVPVWVAQRLWLAGIMFAAGAGVLYLARTLRWDGWTPLVAALAFAFSPYVVEYATTLSVFLLPFAGLPWLIGLAARSLRHGGWRYPAMFALVVLTVGGVNATALAFVGVGPILWIVYETWVVRDATTRQGLATIGRIGVLTLSVSMWWIVALSIQTEYGLPVLDFSETIETVSVSSSAPEVLRGLGMWFFYGRDPVENYFAGATRLLTSVPALALSFLLPGLAVLAAVLTRWRYRAFFVLLVVIGVVIAVASHPFDDPSPLGRVVRDSNSEVVLSLRSSTRAVPLIALGLSVLLATGLAALVRRHRLTGNVALALVGLLAVLNLSPLWDGTLVSDTRDRPEEIPEYWIEAAAAVDGPVEGERILEIPGSDFGSYRWGDTIDFITPGLVERGVIAREVTSYGTPGSLGLLSAFDLRLQQGTLDATAVAPVARLMSAGDVLLRSDLQFERYRTPRPRALWDVLNPPPPGLGDPLAFGEPTPNVPVAYLPLLDETELAIPWDAPDPPPVAVFPVENPRPMVRSAPVDGAMVLAGDGDGIVDAATAGLIGDDQLILYAATLADDAETLERVLGGDPQLVVTDTNRRRGQRWLTLRDQAGYTETAGEEPLADDPSDARLALFPDADDNRSVTVIQGPSARATGYGNPVTFTPDARPQLALDGDPSTAWTVAAFSDPVGERLEVTYPEPVTTGTVTLRQAPGNRTITQAELRFDGDDPLVVDLGPESLDGQTVDVGERTFDTLDVEILAVDPDPESYAGLSGVGFAEITVPGVEPATERVRVPVDVTDALRDAGTGEPSLTYLFTRLRVSPTDTIRDDDERRIARIFDVPANRAFSVAGVVRVRADDPRAAVEASLGLPGADDGGVDVTASDVLPGNARSRPAAALDGDRATAWSPGFGEQTGRFIEFTTADPVTLDRLDLALVTDGRHSVPTELTIDAGGETRVVALPDLEDLPTPGTTTLVPVGFEGLTGDTVRITVTGVRPVTTTDYFSGQAVALPVGIAEIGAPGVTVGPLPEQIPPVCHDDLLEIDGESVPVRVSGSTADALAGHPLPFEGCPAGPGATSDTPVWMTEGTHTLTGTSGATSGLTVDQVVLGPPGPAPEEEQPPDEAHVPTVELDGAGPVSFDATVSGATEPFWLVLGQSHSDGWIAEADGQDLGPPTLVDGYANGWYVDPAEVGSDFSVSMTWAPQRWVWAGLGLTALGALLCLVIIVVGRRPSRDDRRDDDSEMTAPELASPFRLPSVGTSVVSAVVSGVVAAGVSGVLFSPLIGLLTGLATGLALLTAWGRSLLTVGAVASFAAAALYVVVQQYRYGYPVDFAWAEHFGVAHGLALLAVSLLGADAAIAALRGRRRRRAGEGQEPSQR
ncbi:MAG: alpha-(1-_3)-arabinofuranosyltransferase family protein [Acidimicrobiia bacterium]